MVGKVVIAREPVLRAESVHPSAGNPLSTGSRPLSEALAAPDPNDTFEHIARDGRPILIIADHPVERISGVGTLITNLQHEIATLTDGQVQVRLLTGQDVPGIPLSGRLPHIPALAGRRILKLIEDMDPQAIHLMSETPPGGSARRALTRAGIPFTTAYTAHLPEYVETQVSRVSKPLARAAKRATEAYLRQFHSASKGLMVATHSLREQLVAQGYDPELIRSWSRGVDSALFHPSKADPALFDGLERPVSVFSGRLIVEKNLEDFLSMDVPGTKVVIGEGPQREPLSRKHPEVKFLGAMPQAECARHLASADVFVFPSLTDTFGQAQLEANASGLPVVAYDVPGPRDVIASPAAGVLADHDPKAPADNVKRLESAWREAVQLPKAGARRWAEGWSWTQTAKEFMTHLAPLPGSPGMVFGPEVGREFLEAEQALTATTPLRSHPARWAGKLWPSKGLSGTLSKQYTPAEGRVFPLPTRLVLEADIPTRVASEGLTDAEKQLLFVDAPDGRRYARYFIHPDAQDRPFPAEEIPDPVLWVSTPGSSGRTLFVRDAAGSVAPFQIKTSLFKNMGRYKRNIDEERAVRAVKISDEVARIHAETAGRLPGSGKSWDFFPEHFALTSAGDEHSQAGFILRGLPGELTHDILLPWYSMIAAREGKATRWVDELFAASGKARMDDFLWTEMVKPLTELHGLLSIQNGLTPELHQQNFLVRVDPATLRVKGLVIRDMDAHFVDHSLRTHRLNKPTLSHGGWDESMYLFRYGQAQGNQFRSYADKLRTESLTWMLKHMVSKRDAGALVDRADAQMVQQFNIQFPDFAVPDFATLEQGWQALHDAVTTPEERAAYDALSATYVKSRTETLYESVRGKLA